MQKFLFPDLPTGNKQFLFFRPKVERFIVEGIRSVLGSIPNTNIKLGKALFRLRSVVHTGSSLFIYFEVVKLTVLILTKSGA